jgi:hypothetical protein
LFPFSVGEGMTTIIMRVRGLGQAAHWMSHLGSGRMAQALAGALRRRFTCEGMKI